MSQATGQLEGTHGIAPAPPPTHSPPQRRRRGRNLLERLISPAWWEEAYNRLDRITWAVIRLIGLGVTIYIFIRNA